MPPRSTMKPLFLVLPYSVAFWTVFVWAFWPEFRIVGRATRPASQAGSPDSGSCHVIMLGTWLAYAVAVPLASKRAFQFPASLSVAAFGAGLAVLVAGSLLRRHCWRMLGPSFTGDVRVQATQRIVSTGAYTRLRHPSYTAGILMHTGFGLAMGSWGSALVLALVSLAAYMYRIHVEERALLSTLGEPYREFMRGRKRLIPFVY
jgi:protein-S-isoprenylcysteine O-methyltransferase Ste14